MCIAIYKPKGVDLPDTHLEESFYSNPDGAGFAVAMPNGELTVRKGFFTYPEFFDAYRAYAPKAALIHFRIATSGGVNPQMCHPFLLCDGQYALIHNGVLNIVPHKGKSDTATFADSVLTPILTKGVPHTSPALKFLVESAIGKWNKMLIMDRRGKVAYFNEKAGHTSAEGIWYSNDSYRPVQPALKLGTWTENDWKKWAGKDKRAGALLTDFRECEICGDILAYDSIEDYCDACLHDWGEEILTGK